MTASGAILHVRVTPRGGRDAIVGWEAGEGQREGLQGGLAGRACREGLQGGQRVLRIRVGAGPVEGKANEAAIKLLSQALGVPAAALTLRRGQRSRDKTFVIAGLSEGDLHVRLDAAIDRDSV